MTVKLSTDSLAQWSKEQFESAHFTQLGRWFKCAHCQAIIEQGAQHFCGAPWQVRPTDIPPEWWTPEKAKP